MAYGVWERATGRAAFLYERTDEGWRQAWDQFVWLENQAANQRQRRSNTAQWVVILVFLFILYVVLHNIRYQNCAVQPGLLSWPRVCL